MAVASALQHGRASVEDFAGGKMGFGVIVLVDFDTRGNVMAVNDIGEIEHGGSESWSEKDCGYDHNSGVAEKHVGEFWIDLCTEKRETGVSWDGNEEMGFE